MSAVMRVGGNLDKGSFETEVLLRHVNQKSGHEGGSPKTKLLAAWLDL